MAEKCEPCNGTGHYQGPRLGDEPCPVCGGFGVVKQFDVIQHIEFDAETGELRFTDPPEGFDPILLGC